MSKKEFAVKSKADLAKAISYLETLISCFKQGTVSIREGDQAVTLKPAKVVDIELEATQKGDKESLLLLLSWRTSGVSDGELDLQISSAEPTPVATSPRADA